MKRNIRFLTMMALLASFAFSAGVALAADYLGSGYFSTRNLRWRFYGTTSDSGGSYTTPTNNAMYNWDYYTDVSFTKVTDNSYHILPYVGAWGNTGWNGFAYICATNGQCNNTSAWNYWYYYGVAYINTSYLYSHSQTLRQNTIGHEVGHCLSLGHRSDTTSIMYNYQTSVTVPNSYDRSLVNTRY